MEHAADKGRADDGPDYEYTFTITNIAELESLYADLKKLNAFGLKSKDEGHVNDRGGESVRYTINGKDYNVSDSQSNFITKEDAPAFKNALALIIAFAERHREPVITKSTEYKDSDALLEVLIQPQLVWNKPTVEGGP